MQEELISKKELLKVTGISYGQLYRWKRQNLIPEAWFIKQSAFTGQETFFPRERILDRVQQIMDLKDRYSLEELADLFSPQVKSKFFSLDNLGGIQELDQEVIKLFKETFKKDTFAFKEVLFIYALSKLKSHSSLNEIDLKDMVISIQSWLPKLTNMSYRFIVCERQSQTFSLLFQQDASIFLDHKVSELHVYELDELAKDLKLKLNEVLEEEQ